MTTTLPTLTLDDLPRVQNFIISVYADRLLRYGRTSLATLEVLDTPVDELKAAFPEWNLPDKCVYCDETLYQHLSKHNLTVYTQVVVRQKDNPEDFIAGETKVY